MEKATEYNGYVDAVGISTISGWASKIGSDEAITVELYIDSWKVSESIANQFRGDLADAGYGTGRHGFSIQIPQNFQDERSHDIFIKVKNVEFILKGFSNPYKLDKPIGQPNFGTNTSFSVSSSPSVTVIMPTYNRGIMMEATIERFLPCLSKVGGEIIVIDDGSKDDTPDRLARLASQNACLKYESITNGGPGRARNRAASLARGEILVFIGDDVVPIDDDFLLHHQAAHNKYPKRGQAVLGKITWPEIIDFDVNFVMNHIQGEGEQQFGYRYMTPYNWYGWNLFYSSNISIKSSLIDDWLADGFQEAFYLAAFEDPEFALRTHEKLQLTGEQLEVLYMPTANLTHHHKYDVESFIRRQVSTGLMAFEFLKLHPGREDDLGLGELNRRLRDPGTGAEFPVEHYMSIFEGLRSWAVVIDKHYGLGSQNWHGDLLKTVFQLAYYEGYVRAQINTNVNISNGCRYILERLRVMMNRAISTEVLGIVPGFGLV